MKTETEIKNELTENLIVSAAYGDCSLADKMRLWLLIKKQPELKSLFEEYRQTALKVNKISLEEYKNHDFLNRFVLPKTENISENSLSRILTFFLEKPIASAAAVTVFIIMITLGIIFNKPLDNAEYSDKEIALANRQVKQSLAIIGSVFNKTQNTLEKEVFLKRVAKPLNDGITTVNNLFSTGGKNEK